MFQLYNYILISLYTYITIYLYVLYPYIIIYSKNTIEKMTEELKLPFDYGIYTTGTLWKNIPRQHQLAIIGNHSFC